MKSFYCPHRTTVPILSAIGGKPLYIVYDTTEPSTYVVTSVGLLLVLPKEEEEEVELRVCDRPTDRLSYVEQRFPGSDNGRKIEKFRTKQE